MNIYGVLLPLPFDDVFDYSSEEVLSIGQLVVVPFGREELAGMVYKIGKNADIDEKKIKKIRQILQLPLISDVMIKFMEKTAAYNMAPRGLVLKMILGQKTNQLPKQKINIYGLNIKNENLQGIRITEARKAVFDFLDNGKEAEKEEILIATGVSESVLLAMIKSGFLYKKEELIKIGRAHV